MLDLQSVVMAVLRSDVHLEVRHRASFHQMYLACNKESQERFQELDDVFPFLCRHQKLHWMNS